MEIYFESLLKTSAICGGAILLIMAVSPLLKKGHTVFWRYLLWMVLGVRLLIPFDFSVPNPAITLPSLAGLSGSQENLDSENTQVPFANAKDSASTADGSYPGLAGINPQAGSGRSDTQTDNSYVNIPEGRAHGEALPDNSPALADTDPQAGNDAADTQADKNTSLLLLLWALGAALLLLYQTVGCWQFRRKVTRTKTYLFSRENIPVYVSPIVRSPMLTGIWKPQILLPQQAYEEEQLQFILSHELTHYRRKDLLAKLLLSAARTLHWFNPLVWYMERRAAKDIELLCDSQVVRGFTKEDKKRYSKMLLALAAPQNAAGVLCASGSSKETRTLKERFTNICSGDGRKRGILPALIGTGAILSASLFIAFGIGCGTFQKAQDPSAAGKLSAKESKDTEATDAASSGTDTATGAAAQNTGTASTGIPLSLPELALEKAAEAMYTDGFPQLIYASSKRAILYGSWGLMVFDIKQEKIGQLLDLSAIGIETGKGSAAHIEASADGTQLLLYNAQDTEHYLYNIDQKKLELTSLAKLQDSYSQFLTIGETDYALTEDKQTVRLSKDSLYPREGEGKHFHQKDLAGLSLVISDRSIGNADILPLFREYYEPRGEAAFPSLQLKDLERRVIVDEFLYEDEDGWRYYLEEDSKNESRIRKLAKALEPLLLVRRKDGTRQVLEDLMFQDLQACCPVVFTDGRIVYRAAANADQISIKDPVMVSIAMDGSDRKTADTIQYHTFNNMCADQGWIYYTGWTNDNAMPLPLCRIPADFSSEPQLVGELPGLLCGVTDGYAYYLTNSEKSPGLYCRDLSSGQECLIDIWGTTAEDFDYFNSRMLLYKTKDPGGKDVFGCHAIFSYKWGGYMAHNIIFSEPHFD